MPENFLRWLSHWCGELTYAAPTNFQAMHLFEACNRRITRLPLQAGNGFSPTKARLR